jgi:signal transduction histidine kinase
VDMNLVLQNVVEDLELVISEKNAQVNILPFPNVEGSSVLIHQLFYNLMNNALKFSKKETQPVITISSSVIRKGPDEIVEISFVDNGIGFNQDEAKKIFQSFVRLHPKDRYEGTGLGLALCHRIIERHGGSIDAVSSPGEGASFTIRLPKKQHSGNI